MTSKCGTNKKVAHEAKAELNCEIYNLEENTGKIKSVLLSEQLCEPKSLGVALKITGVEKIPRKTCGYGQPRGHLIRVLNERSEK